jgi:succinoglycan biosynthesis protein ExoA
MEIHRERKVDPKYTVSVVIAVYNDENHIGKALSALKNQTYPKDRYEIIVVDDGSTDGTPDVIKRFDGIKCIEQANSGPSAARNNGIMHSTGDIVMFTDSDCEPNPDWIETLAATHKEFEGAENSAAVGGAQLGHREDPDFAKKVDRFLRSVGILADYVKTHEWVKRVSHNASCNSSYKRELIARLGGFRPSMFPGEDVDLDRRIWEAGFSVLYTPRAIVYHHRVDTPERWRRMLKAYGRASAHNMLIHGFFRLVQLFPPVIVFGLLALAALTIMGITKPWTALGFILASFLMAWLFVWVRSGLSIVDTTVFTAQTLFYFTAGFWSAVLAHVFVVPLHRSKNLESIGKTRL